MADESNPQTSFSEGSPQEKLPEVDVPSSPTTELNTITQGDLDRLWETCSFPMGVQTRIPGKGKTVLSASSGEVAFYEAAFPAGLRFLVHPTIKRILNFYGICPAQLSPNAWRNIISVLVIWHFHRRHLSLNEFRCLYTLLKDDWEFHSTIPREERVVRVPRSWGAPGKQCNKVSVLSPTEEERFRQVFEKIGGGHFKIRMILTSRTFYKYFAPGRVEVSSNDDGATEGDIKGEAEGGIREEAAALRVMQFSSDRNMAIWVVWVYEDRSNLFEGLAVFGIPGVYQVLRVMPVVSMKLTILFLFLLPGSVLIFPGQLTNSLCLISVSTWAMGVLRGDRINLGHLLSGSFLLGSSFSRLLRLASASSYAAIYLSALFWRAERVSSTFLDKESNNGPGRSPSIIAMITTLSLGWKAFFCLILQLMKLATKSRLRSPNESIIPGDNFLNHDLADSFKVICLPELGGQFESGGHFGPQYLLCERQFSFVLPGGRAWQSALLSPFLDRCYDSGNGLLSDESDEMSQHQEWEQLEVVDWPWRGAVSSGRYFHSSVSFVRPYRGSHGVGPPDPELG
ncbi:hypothetical protein Acr_11g0009870 [Actinidia rufa]|uniref:Transposase (putative) gypsy type domain-containing protein n=1 Tax=Actinidia rufa TaxID=165716 RepID=A0A7J0FDC4_9ERIC|nr:hypothetical protein Acr_11g0009870 [Actinidia rufa]